MKFHALFVMSLLFAVPAQAETLTWERNAEADMKDYGIYACFTKGCTVVQTLSMLHGTVAQTAVGVKPTLVMDLANKDGAIAVSARDMAGNESGLSVPVPFFDRVSPAIPVSPALQ